jgi:ubiquinone/menaquinone biosynthesis C-methylase UbiE
MQSTKSAAPAKRQDGELGYMASYYDLVMTGLTLGREKKLRQTTIQLSRIKPGDKVLEIGSGTGTLSLAAKAQVGPSGEVAGLDLAPEMVAKARSKAARKSADVSFQDVPFARPSRNANRSGSNKEPPKAGIRSASCSIPP